MNSPQRDNLTNATPWRGFLYAQLLLVFACTELSLSPGHIAWTRIWAIAMIGFLTLFSLRNIPSRIRITPSLLACMTGLGVCLAIPLWGRMGLPANSSVMGGSLYASYSLVLMVCLVVETTLSHVPAGRALYWILCAGLIGAWIKCPAWDQRAWISLALLGSIWMACVRQTAPPDSSSPNCSKIRYWKHIGIGAGLAALILVWQWGFEVPFGLAGSGEESFARVEPTAGLLSYFLDGTGLAGGVALLALGGLHCAYLLPFRSRRDLGTIAILLGTTASLCSPGGFHSPIPWIVWVASWAIVSQRRTWSCHAVWPALALAAGLVTMGIARSPALIGAMVRQIGQSDVLIHLWAGALLACLTGWCMGIQKRWTYVAVLGSGLLGGMGELIQLVLSTGRSNDWRDWRSHLFGTGILLALLVTGAILRQCQKRYGTLSLHPIARRCAQGIWYALLGGIVLFQCTLVFWGHDEPAMPQNQTTVNDLVCVTQPPRAKPLFTHAYNPLLRTHSFVLVPVAPGRDGKVLGDETWVAFSGNRGPTIPYPRYCILPPGRPRVVLRGLPFSILAQHDAPVRYLGLDQAVPMVWLDAELYMAANPAERKSLLLQVATLAKTHSAQPIILFHGGRKTWPHVAQTLRRQTEWPVVWCKMYAHFLSVIRPIGPSYQANPIWYITIDSVRQSWLKTISPTHSTIVPPNLSTVADTKQSLTDKSVP